MALHSETAIYKETFELSKLVTSLVANMPRNYKPTFGADFQRQCFNLVMRVYQANTVEDRVSILARMREEVEAANLSARMLARSVVATGKPAQTGMWHVRIEEDHHENQA